MLGEMSAFTESLRTVLERMIVETDGQGYLLVTAAPYYLQYLTQWIEGRCQLTCEAVSTDRLEEFQQLSDERIEILTVKFEFDYPNSPGGGNYRKKVDLEEQTPRDIALEAEAVLAEVYAIFDFQIIRFSLRIRGGLEMQFKVGAVPDFA